jgi:hypothetical protein
VHVDKLGGTEWDVACDGRIATAIPIETSKPDAARADHTVVYVQDFADEVRRRVKEETPNA